MRDSPWFTGSETRRRFLTVGGSATGAAIPDLVAFFLPHLNHRFFAEGVILILTNFKHVCRAGFNTLATPVAFIGVYCQEPVT